MPRRCEMSEATAAKTRLRKFRRQVNREVKSIGKSIKTPMPGIADVCAGQTAMAGHDGVHYQPVGSISDALRAVLALPGKQGCREIRRGAPFAHPSGRQRLRIEIRGDD